MIANHFPPRLTVQQYFYNWLERELLFTVLTLAPNGALWVVGSLRKTHSGLGHAFSDDGFAGPKLPGASQKEWEKSNQLAES